MPFALESAQKLYKIMNFIWRNKHFYWEKKNKNIVTKMNRVVRDLGVIESSLFVQLLHTKSNHHIFFLLLVCWFFDIKPLRNRLLSFIFFFHYPSSLIATTQELIDNRKKVEFFFSNNYYFTVAKKRNCTLDKRNCYCT